MGLGTELLYEGYVAEQVFVCGLYWVWFGLYIRVFCYEPTGNTFTATTAITATTTTAHRHRPPFTATASVTTASTATAPPPPPTTVTALPAIKRHHSPPGSTCYYRQCEIQDSAVPGPFWKRSWRCDVCTSHGGGRGGRRPQIGFCRIHYI